MLIDKITHIIKTFIFWITLLITGNYVGDFVSDYFIANSTLNYIHLLLVVCIIKLCIWTIIFLIWGFIHDKIFIKIKNDNK